MEVKKKFSFEDVELRLVEREEKYMNSERVSTYLRVITPTDKVLPISFSHRNSLKKCVEETISMLEGFKKRGADVKAELLK